MVRAGFGAAAGVLVCIGIGSLVGGTAQASTAPTPAPPTQTSPATPAPPPTNPPTTPPTTPPPVATTPPTVPYYQVVQNDCADYPDDEELATKLEEAKKGNGSTHLVSMARYCGVMFSDDAEVDPKLDRPQSNLEYAVYTKDDPFYTPGWDEITANDAQIAIVVDASTAKWLELNPPPTTVPVATTAPPATTAAATATSVATSATTTVTNTTTPDDDDDPSSEGGGSDAVQIFGMLLLGAGAVSWGIYGVRDQLGINQD